MLPTLLVLFGIAGMARAEGPAPLRAQMGSGELLYHLATFVVWPAQSKPAGPLQACFAGADPAEEQFRRVLESGPLVSARPMVYRRVYQLPEMRRCHLLFLGRSLGGQIGAILPALRGAAVLTVGAIDGFARMGGMVELIPEPLTRPLQLNAGAARREGLTFRAPLLRVSTLRPAGAPGE